jgi:hypothetical protein
MSDYSWDTFEDDARFRAAYNYMQESGGIAVCFQEGEGEYPCILTYESSDWLLAFAAWLLDLAHRVLAPAPGGAHIMTAPRQISSFEELAVAHWTALGPDRAAILDLTDEYGCLADSINNGPVTLTYRMDHGTLRALAEFYSVTAFKAKNVQWWRRYA